MSTWVLLRGLAREAGHWGDFPRRLAEALPDARIIALDLPGSGSRYAETSPLRVEAMAADCRTRLRALGIVEPVFLLAMSLGGMVAVAWADDWPDELAGCVLINTSLRGISPLRQRLRPAGWPALLRALASRDVRTSEAAVLRLTTRQTPATVLDDWVALRRQHPMRRANVLRQLAAAARYRAPRHPPPVPMLILGSAADGMVDVRCSAEIAARWHQPLVLHPDAGHDLPLDDGAWVAQQVLRWLRGEAASPQSRFSSTLES
ncbi:alpha/beta hydrolase [Azoarcus sp. DD4]|uniref:alpha/beta fold hydrolase n=1 Tax=Azoarcus sp. DD4 TaxID=2027405 RepID=UPI001128A239|nr:alpha/beta hydrolase [Azoarcus sp. DD4]QDF97697.1 alpha/beta hydrolase [Azoarcus sp. DD4]